MRTREIDTIRTLRLNAGLTQTQLARLINSPQQWLSGVEHGHIKPRPHNVGKLARGLKVDRLAVVMALAGTEVESMEGGVKDGRRH